LGQVFYRTVLVAPEYIWKKQRVKSDAQPINKQSTPEYIWKQKVKLDAQPINNQSTL
jgi:hypothetical protein